MVSGSDVVPSLRRDRVPRRLPGGSLMDSDLVQFIALALAVCAIAILASAIDE